MSNKDYSSIAEPFDKNKKPQRFFDRYLNNDLDEVSDRLEIEYKRIENNQMRGVSKIDETKDIFGYTKSSSTMKSREYNAFQMYYPWMHDLYSAVVDMVKEACEYYEIDYNSEQWMVASWFNINSRAKGAKLDWHDHLNPELNVPAFHGYYSVKAEPSQTHYNINDTLVVNENKNNRAILSLVGFPHAMGDWDWDGSRITIAYDIMPLRLMRQEGHISNNNHVDEYWEQHFFPLPKNL